MDLLYFQLLKCTFIFKVPVRNKQYSTFLFLELHPQNAFLFFFLQKEEVMPQQRAVMFHF